MKLTLFVLSTKAERWRMRKPNTIKKVAFYICHRFHLSSSEQRHQRSCTSTHNPSHSDTNTNTDDKIRCAHDKSNRWWRRGEKNEKINDPNGRVTLKCVKDPFSRKRLSGSGTRLLDYEARDPVPDSEPRQ